jgi:hypothetical protein
MFEAMSNVLLMKTLQRIFTQSSELRTLTAPEQVVVAIYFLIHLGCQSQLWRATLVIVY